MTEKDIQKIFKSVNLQSNKVLRNDEEILNNIQICVEELKNYYNSIWKESLEEITYNMELTEQMRNMSEKEQKFYTGKLVGLTLALVILTERKGELEE